MLGRANTAINRIRHGASAGLEQLGGKCVRALMLAVNELAILF